MTLFWLKQRRQREKYVLYVRFGEQSIVEIMTRKSSVNVSKLPVLKKIIFVSFQDFSEMFFYLENYVNSKFTH